MKTIFQLIVAGVLGGFIAIGAAKMLDKEIIIYDYSEADKYDTSDRASSNQQHETNTSRQTNFVEAAEIANPAVVHIKAQNKAYVDYQQRDNYDPFEDFWGYRRSRSRPQAGTGSGVLISEDGYIVTNNHVVGFADYIEVILEDGRTYQAQKLGTDPSTDLAVIKIEGEGKRLPHLEFANSDNLEVGQWVVAVGNPFNLTSTVTAGIISAMGRELDIIKGQKTIEEFIQTDAVVNPGNSGGALVNVEGELIGINTAISSPTGVYAGYSFAIPANLVQRVVNEIKETGGDIQRAMLGVNILPISAAEADGYNLGIDYGVVVADLGQDRYGRRTFSSAEAAGVEIGDVIIGVDNKEVRDFEQLSDALKFSKIGDTVDLEIYRAGKKLSLPVKLRKGV
jgi:S1-C subfamily serine protease